MLRSRGLTRMGHSVVSAGTGFMSDSSVDHYDGFWDEGERPEVQGEILILG
jgi:hypothetical protein